MTHHHHHDYVDTCFLDEFGCEACREAERRKDDDWNRPHRWVYDFGPTCECADPAAPRTVGWVKP